MLIRRRLYQQQACALQQLVAAHRSVAAPAERRAARSSSAQRPARDAHGGDVADYDGLRHGLGRERGATGSINGSLTNTDSTDCASATVGSLAYGSVFVSSSSHSAASALPFPDAAASVTAFAAPPRPRRRRRLRPRSSCPSPRCARHDQISGRPMTRRLRSKEMVRYLRASSRARPLWHTIDFSFSGRRARFALLDARRRHAHPATGAVPFGLAIGLRRSRRRYLGASYRAFASELALTGIAFTLGHRGATGLSIALKVAAAIWRPSPLPRPRRARLGRDRRERTSG